MSVVEIAKIKVRRGQANVDGVPQLEGGEFGWAVDTRTLYIGNGALDEGAPTIGNTRLLSEYDLPNIFYLTSSTYIYANGRLPTIFTDPSGSTQNNSTVQAKLDSQIPTLVDFGVTPESLTISQGIQNAIDQLYLNSDKGLKTSRTPLRLPAGIYNVTATIYVPPYVTLQGAGKGMTVLNIMTTNTTLMQFCDSTSSAGSYVVFVPGSNLITSIGHPSNINISGISFKYDASIVDYENTLPLLRADCVKSSVIRDCSFSGSTVTNTSSYSAIEIRGQGAITTDNLVLDNVDFSYLGCAIVSDYDVQNVKVCNSSFTNLYRGLSFNEEAVIGNDVGPSDIKVYDSKFQDIMREAWVIGSNVSGTKTSNSSRGNVYRDVGNDMQGEDNAVCAVLNFATPGNTSVEDTFARHDFVNSTSTALTLVPIVDGEVFLNQHTAYTFALQTGATETLLKLPYAGSAQSTEVKYILRKPIATITREGTLRVNTWLDGTANISDNFSYSGASSGGLVFSAELNTVTNTVSVLYVSTDADGSIEYQFNQLQ